MEPSVDKLNALSQKLTGLMKSMLDCYSSTQSALCRDLGLTPAEAAFLFAVCPGEKLSLTAISRRLELSKGRVSRLLDALAGKGLLEQRDNPADRRHSVIRLTPEGRKKRRRLGDAQSERCHLVLRGLPEERLDDILPALEELSTVMRTAKARTKGPISNPINPGR